MLFYQPGYYFSNPGEIFVVWQGGMSFHGGALGVLVVVVLYTRIMKISLLSVADAVCAQVPIGLFLGRMANFVNGELYGRVSDVSWAMVFPGGGPEPRHPSQIYEAVLEGLVLFAILAVAVHMRRVVRRPGTVAGLFFAGYGVARIIAELFREPDAFLGFILPGISMGQVLSPSDDRARGSSSSSASRRCLGLTDVRAGRPGDDRFSGRDKGADTARRADQRRHVHGALPPSSHPRLLPPGPAHRCGRRLRYCARGEPNVRRADRALVRGGMAEHGPAETRAPRGARTGSRHPPRRRAARRADRAGLSRRHRRAPGRVEPELARRAGRSARRRPQPTWHERFETVPPGPVLVIANEFFDALPIRQFGRVRQRVAGARCHAHTLIPGTSFRSL